MINSKSKSTSSTHFLNTKIIKGIPQEPVLVVELLSPSSISPFVARNAVWGGVALVASSNAPERASRNLLRPKSNIIELSPYMKGDYDIYAKLNSSDGYIRHNGVLIQTTRGKSDFIADLCRRLNVKRAMFHLYTSELISIVEKMGLRVHESLDVYLNLGKKTSLNNALEIFSCRHKRSTIGRFGVNFHSLEEVADEVLRLAQYGISACVKFDASTVGSLTDSGAGVYFIPDFNYFGLKKNVEDYIRKQLKKRDFQDKKLEGLVQMYVPNSTILSVSSGQKSDNKYYIYEAHTQTQVSYQKGKDKALTADGAVPLKEDQYSPELIELIWPQLTQFYIDNNITGDQNVNLIILPPQLLKIARKIYHNNHLSSIQLIDLNPRPISGAKRIMGRFVEETGQLINWKNFAARSLHLDPFFAANPHLIYRAAAGLGLKAGKGGNMSLTNFGTLIPERIRERSSKIMLKVFVQNIPNPQAILARLEEIISTTPKSSFSTSLDIKKPEEIPDANEDQVYKMWLEGQFTQVFTNSFPF